MKKAVIPLLLLAVGVAGWFWWSGRDTGAADELTLHGNVDIRQISLAFDGSGRITELCAEEGDQVTAGELLGVLDTRSLEIQARQAEAQVEAQRQTLLRLRNGSRPEEITQARAQLASAQATATRADLDYSRATRLQAKADGVITEKTVDQSRADAKAANAKVNELRAVLRLAELGPRVEDVANAKAQLNASEAYLELLRYQISQGQLRAPSNAVVRSRLLEPGDMATSQKPVFALALTEPKWVRVYVREADLGRIRPGMEAGVFTDSRPDQPVPGKVGYISSVADFTPKAVQTEELRTSLVYEVRIIVDDGANTLRLGQPATVRIHLGAAS
ncbi:MAG: HlyD family efflux transporter periplasmic adaptor subunit [Hyphomicrobiaceae bacterium]